MRAKRATLGAIWANCTQHYDIVGNAFQAKQARWPGYEILRVSCVRIRA